MGTNFSYFVTCPKGVEDLLLAEAQAQGGESARIGPGGVYCEGPLALAYQLCLHSRTANRVLCILAQSPEFDADEDQALYRFVYDFPWEAHFSPAQTIAVDFSGTTEIFKNTQYGAMRVKDALVDRFAQREGVRPSVAKTRPDIRINARLHKRALTLALDLSGESLHKRGYRLAPGAAPLKENLAAALLLRAGWPQIAAAGGALIDPMCGSGTLLIEAAWMAAGKPPGLHRDFGFHGWRAHDAELWQRLKQEALTGFTGTEPSEPRLFGFDRDSRAVAVAQKNVASAECQEWVQLGRQAVAELQPPAGTIPGLIICNPPYGERLGEKSELEPTYRDLANAAKHFPGWQLAVFTGNAELASAMRLRAKKRNRLFNGPIAAQLLMYDLVGQEQARLRSDPTRVEELSPGAAMVANRLQKNLKKLKTWREKNRIEAFRVFDADMPEYAAAIDLYAGQPHIAEYQPPKSVDERAAQKRLRELCAAVAVVFGVAQKSLPVKSRRRTRGTDQYQAASARQGEYLTVREGRAQLLVNLHDYLDTGLFLDHRALRLRIAAEAAGKDFLNLFCYTASASVHAALAGARSTVSVDMSNAYLAWARRNFELNRISAQGHELVREDCFTWLAGCRRGFDLIMLDPPSFSNSKKMAEVLDVQRDHVRLIERCMELLRPGGTLYFSNNLRGFKLDREALARYAWQDITAETIDEDFKRNPRIHSCFQIRHA